MPLLSHVQIKVLILYILCSAAHIKRTLQWRGNWSQIWLWVELWSGFLSTADLSLQSAVSCCCSTPLMLCCSCHHFKKRWNAKIKVRYLEMWEFLVLVVDLPEWMLFRSLGGLWWLSDLGLWRETFFGYSFHKAESQKFLTFLLVTNVLVLFAVGFLGDGWGDFLLYVLLLFVRLLLLALVLVRVFGVMWISVGTLHLGSIFLRPLRLFLLLFLWGRRNGVLLGHLLCHQLGVYPGFPVGPNRVDSEYQSGTNCAENSSLNCWAWRL